MEADRFCESPINTSFTKFNQRVQKLDLLKRRQSYSEFEELIEKKVRVVLILLWTEKIHNNTVESLMPGA